MECRRITGEKGPYPSGVGGNIIQWGREGIGLGIPLREVDFAGPLKRITYGGYARSSGGVVNAYRLFFDDGSVFEITDA